MEFRRAMGAREGDELTLSNLWASVTIEKMEGHGYLCCGAEGDDTQHLLLEEAVNHGLGILAQYEEGRWD